MKDYHFKMCKVGAVKKDPQTGKLVKVSDFMRGAPWRKANDILNFMRKCATGEIQFKKEKEVKPVPKWHDQYLKDTLALEKQKQKENEKPKSVIFKEYGDLYISFYRKGIVLEILNDIHLENVCLYRLIYKINNINYACK